MTVTSIPKVTCFVPLPIHQDAILSMDSEGAVEREGAGFRRTRLLLQRLEQERPVSFILLVIALSFYRLRTLQTSSSG